MIVVGYLYNRNGMAAWCIEAVVALQQAGHDVVLIKSKNIALPESISVRTFDYDTNTGVQPAKRRVLKKVSDKINKYYQIMPFSRIKNDFLPHLHQQLLSNAITPRYYLLNQANLINREVRVPQYVVGWSNPPGFGGYLHKVLLLSHSFSSFWSNLYGAIYWYKCDVQGYKIASGILSVSKTLSSSLLKKYGSRKMNVHTVYPGFRFEQQVTASVGEPVKLVMVALQLDDKRKGLDKVIKGLKKMDMHSFTLTLVGNYTEEFKKQVLQDAFPAKFTGLLKREESIKLLAGQDVFLFGSVIDDWGYVQIEAMANGVAVFSPHKSPFDEIVGNEDYLYELGNEQDMCDKLKKILSDRDCLLQSKKWFRERYLHLFTARAFGNALAQTLHL